MDWGREIKGHVVIISGFLQNASRRNGMWMLWQRIWNTIADWNGCYLWPVQTWQADVSGIAEAIQRSGARRALVIVFSWGAPTGLRLCEALGERGIEVEHLICADPVRRPGALMGLVKRLADRMTFAVPGNVRRAMCFYQRRTWPRGFLLKGKGNFWSDQPLDVGNKELHGVGHIELDDSPAFHAYALRSVVDFVEGRGR